MKKNENYDIIKIIVTILVVLAHVTRMYTGNGVIIPREKSYILDLLTKFIYGFHMPLFMMISGAVYYYCIYELNKYKNKKKFILNKIKRLMIPYFIFGIFYVAPVMTLFKFSSMNYFEYILKGILIPLQSRHLWFLYYLFIYQMLTYFVLKNSNNIKILLGTIILSVTANLLNIPLISDIAYYYIFFILGLLYNLHYEFIKNITDKKYSIPIFFIFYIGMLFLSSKIAMLKALTAFVGIALFINLYMVCLSRNNSIVNNKVILFLKKYSMGIYLFHPMIIYIAFYYFNEYAIAPIILSLSIFVISICISIILTFIIKHTHFKFVLGE